MTSIKHESRQEAALQLHCMNCAADLPAGSIIYQGNTKLSRNMRTTSMSAEERKSKMGRLRLVSILWGRLSTGENNVGALVHGAFAKLFGRELQAKGMRASTSERACFTSLIFPILLCDKNDINPPDDDGLAAFNRFRGIDQIPPNQIPARVVVMGLQFPRPFAALGFETNKRRRRRTAASSRKIRKPLLGEIAVATFFVDAEAIEGTNAIDADECAKDVRLFLIDIDELGKFAFNVIDGLAESGDRET